MKIKLVNLNFITKRTTTPANLNQIFRSQKNPFSSSIRKQDPNSKSPEEIQDKKAVVVIKEDNIEKAGFNANPVARTSDSMPRPIFESRTAFIFKPCKNVMQSGSNNSNQWILQFNSDVPRWENPVMGWSSSRDPVQALTLKFDSSQEAIRYAQSEGWAYEVKEDKETILKPKNYAENFAYSKGKLKIIKTK